MSVRVNKASDLFTGGEGNDKQSLALNAIMTSYGVYTLSDTETDTCTETDNTYTELNGNLCCYLSRCSVKYSAYYSETHSYRSRHWSRSVTQCEKTIFTDSNAVPVTVTVKVNIVFMVTDRMGLEPRFARHHRHSVKL